LKYATGIQITGENIYVQNIKENRKKAIIFSNVLKYPCKINDFNNDADLSNLEKNLDIIYKKHKSFFKKSEIIITFPDSLSYISNEYVPFNTPQEELSSAIELNVELDVPFDKLDSLIHWQEIPNIRGERNKKEYLISTSSKSLVSKLVGIFTKAKVIPYAFETYSFSHLRTALDQQDTFIGVIYRDCELTSYVYEKKGLRFVESSTIIKSDDSLQKIVLEIIKVLNFYTSDKKGLILDAFHFDIDSTSEAKKVISLLEDKLSAKIKIIERKPELKDIDNLSLSGASLRGIKVRQDDTEISLLPLGVKEEYEKEKSFLIYNAIGNIFSVLAIIILLLFLVFAFFLNQFRADLDNRISINATKTNAAYKGLEAKSKDFNDQVKRMKELEYSKQEIEKKFSVALGNLPGSIKLTKISFDAAKSNLIVEGISAKREGVIEYKDNLEKASYFSEIDLPLSSISQKENTVFKITLKVGKSEKK